MVRAGVLPLSFAGLLLLGAPAVRADTDADRMKRLEDQVKTLLEQQQKLKDQQAENDKTIALLLETLKDVKAGKQGGKPVVTPPTTGNGDKFTFSGDASTRLDLTNLSSLQTGLFPEGTQGALRERFRLNVSSPFGSHSEVGAQLSTGQTATPTLAFTILGNADLGKTFSLAQAYFNYYFGAKDKPIPYSRLPKYEPTTTRLTFGKMPLAYWKAEVGGPAAFSSEAVWDNDFMPEGANLRVPIRLGTDKVSLIDNVTYHAVNYPTKRRFIGLVSDTYGFTNQVYLNANLIRAGFTYSVFDNLNSGLFDPTFLPGQGADPTAATNAFLLRPPLQATNAHYSHGPAAGFGANTFNLINFTGQIIPQVKPNAWQPFLVYEYLHNGSVSTLNDGYGISFGVTKGDPRKRGSQTAWFTWRDIDADATLATFADSDLGAGTDYRGFQLGYTFRLQDNLQLRLAYHDFEGAPNKTNSTQRFFFDFARYF